MLRLPRFEAERIIAQARDCMPAEACGLIAGARGMVTRIYPIPNSDPSIFRYTMDPRAQFDALQDIEANDWDLLAMYHSHTHTAAYPSPTDVQLAFYPDSLYVIVSLQQEAPVIRAFSIVDGEIHEEEVGIV